MLRHKKILGDAVRRARVSLHLTQNQVAALADTTCHTISDIENYKGNPKYTLLFALIRELGLNENEIFHPEQKQRISAAAQRSKALLDNCSEEELERLLPILEAALTAIRNES